jgi:hypothetical protein
VTGTLPSGGNGAYQYQWESSANQNTWGPIQDATTIDLLTINNQSNMYWRRKVISGNCPSVASNISTVTIQIPIINQITTASQTICAGSSVATLTGGLPSGGSGIYLYQWQRGQDTINWNNIPSATSISYTPNIATQSYWYRRIAASGICAPAESNNILVAVDSILHINTQPLNQNPRIGDTISLLVISPNIGVSYQWQVNTGNGFFNIIDTGQYIGTLSNLLVINNITVMNQGNKYRCVITRGACMVISGDSEILINYNKIYLGEDIDETDIENILLWPNPGKNEFKVSLPVSIIENIKCYNVAGQELSLEWEKISDIINVNASNLPAGFYMILIETKRGSFTKRWSKE